VSKATPDPPEEAQRLLEKDYSYLNKLDADGWSVELTRLYNLSVDNRLGLHEADLNTHTFGEVGESGEVSEVMTVHVSVPPVEFVEFNCEGFLLPPERLPALIVDARASPKVIRERFESALAELRDRFPPPIAKPGPHATNNVIDQDTFSSWIKWRIVQLAELFAWRATLDAEEAKKFLDWVIGIWMWGDESEPRKVSDAKNVLKRAIASRHALMSQITHEMPPPQIAEQMTLDLILKNLRYAQNAQGEPEILLPQEIKVLIAQAIKRGD
jgi:hypothetical protein